MMFRKCFEDVSTTDLDQEKYSVIENNRSVMILITLWDDCETDVVGCLSMIHTNFLPVELFCYYADGRRLAMMLSGERK